jgi:branched-chain amino acid transport system ATP-binding protein
LLLDEPLEGLAPILVEELVRALRRILRDEGMAAILVEQNAQKVLSVTDRSIILERGCIVYEGDSAALKSSRHILEAHLGVTQAGPSRNGHARSAAPH